MYLSEYETYPCDGSGLGDYLKLPQISLDVTYYLWGNPEHKNLENQFTHVLKNYAVLYIAMKTHWNENCQSVSFSGAHEECVIPVNKYGLHLSKYETSPDLWRVFGDVITLG